MRIKVKYYGTDPRTDKDYFFSSKLGYCTKDGKEVFMPCSMLDRLVYDTTHRDKYNNLGELEV